AKRLIKNHIATPWPEGDFHRIGQFVDPALDVPAGGRSEMQLLCRHRDAPKTHRCRNRHLPPWVLRLAVLLSLDRPAGEKMSEAIFLESILPILTRNSVRRFGRVKTVVDPQRTGVPSPGFLRGGDSASQDGIVRRAYHKAP